MNLPPRNHYSHIGTIIDSSSPLESQRGSYPAATTTGLSSLSSALSSASNSSSSSSSQLLTAPSSSVTSFEPLHSVRISSSSQTGALLPPQGSLSLSNNKDNNEDYVSETSKETNISNTTGRLSTVTTSSSSTSSRRNPSSKIGRLRTSWRGSTKYNIVNAILQYVEDNVDEVVLEEGKTKHDMEQMEDTVFYNQAEIDLEPQNELIEVTTTVVIDDDMVPESGNEEDRQTTESGSTKSDNDTTASSYKDPAHALRDELYKYMRDEPEMFDWIQDALGDGVWYYDMTETIWYSPAFKALFGYTDYEGANVVEWSHSLIHPDDLGPTMEDLTNHIEKGTPFDRVIRYRHKDGSIVWVRCHGKAIYNAEGIPVRMLGAHNDITELMKVQERLREKEEVLDLLCTTSLDGYWDWNMTTGALQMSTRFKSLLGYEDADLPNRIETWWSLLHPDDVLKLQEAIEQCKIDTTTTNNSNASDGSNTKPPLLNIVLRYRRKNGTIARMLAQGVAQSLPCEVQSSSSPKQWVRMFGTHTDVTYLEEARMARDANAAKTTFLATMSHEIRTPLNAVLGMAQVLMTTTLTEDQKDCVTTLHNSGTHLLSLLNDILDFSQIEAGIISLCKEPMDIQGTIRDVLDVFQHTVQQKDVVLTFETHLPPDRLFLGDSERIRQIIFNLLGNAMKFTHNGAINVTIQPCTHPDSGDGIELFIADTGCGIEQDQLEYIFDFFRQASHEIRSKYGGSGLGLSICKRLIEAMGGSITVRSILGHGSTFRVWLPGLLPPNNPNNSCSNDSNIQQLQEEERRTQQQTQNEQQQAQPQQEQPLPELQIQHPIRTETVPQTANDCFTDLNASIDVNMKSSQAENNRCANASEAVVTMSTKPINSVYLYEELVLDHGSVEGALWACSIPFHHVKDSHDLLERLRPEDTQRNNNLQSATSFVVIHCQSPVVPTRFHEFVHNLLMNIGKEKHPPRMIIFDVGRKIRNMIPSNCRHIYNGLPIFSTSIDLYKELFIPFPENVQEQCRELGNPNCIKLSSNASQLSSTRTILDGDTGRNAHSPSKKANSVLESKATDIEPASLKILVAEDNIINQKVIKRLLSRFPCTVELANNGVEAVEQAKKARWDLIFMDIMMPELDGLEATKIIRQTDSVTPIVALTANATTDDQEKCYDVGMNGFMTKPVSIELLRKLLQKTRSNSVTTTTVS